MNDPFLRFDPRFVLTALMFWTGSSDPPCEAATLGREVAVARHLVDGEESVLSTADLLAHGRRLFLANWTGQEGGGRPLTKGTGSPLSDATAPLVFPRNFNRVSGPDANSCAGCHHQPVTGGNGDIVANVFVTGQRFDFATFDGANAVPTGGAVDERGEPVTQQSIANSRSTPGMFGAGFLEMVARRMTADLQAARDATPPGGSTWLESAGVSFGRIRRGADGTWDVTRVEGLAVPSLVTSGPADPPSLIVRPFHQAGNVVSLRQFSNNAFNHHHGIQSVERFGEASDPDGDGFTNELSRADVTAATLFQAAMAVPGRVIPNDPEIEVAVLIGEERFVAVGCARCHVPNLPLDREGWVFTEPNPYNPPGNLRPGDVPEVRLDLTRPDLPAPRLQPFDGIVHVPAFTDLKLHDICDGEADPNIEVIDMNQPAGSPGFFAGNRRFLTRKLWGCGSKPNYFHHGQYTTMREAILAHGGEAAGARSAFLGLAERERDCVIEFLKTLRVLAPGTPSVFVDEDGAPKTWPPLRFTAITRVGGGLRLAWPGDTGLYAPPRWVQVRQAVTVEEPLWSEVGSPTTAGESTVRSEGGLGVFRLEWVRGTAGR